MQNDVIALDVGGSKIAGAVITPARHILRHHQVETPQTWQGFIDAVAVLVHHLDPSASLQVGMCLPGYVDPAVGPVAISNIPTLAGTPLRAELERHLGVSVRLMNDAQAFLAGAAMALNINTCKTVFGAILGTGVGGGMMCEGQVVPGLHGIAGEWGQIGWPGAAPDTCRPAWLSDGQIGRIEDWLGARALADLGSQISGQKFASPRGVIDAMADGIDWAVEVRMLYARRLARVLLMIILVLDPAVIVLGGGLSRMPGLVLALMPVLAELMPLSPLRTLVQIAPEAGNLSLQGAAQLWFGSRGRPAR